MTNNVCPCEEWGNYTEEEYQIFQKVLSRSLVAWNDKDKKDQVNVFQPRVLLSSKKEIPSLYTISDMFHHTRGYEHLAYCAQCDRGKGVITTNMRESIGKRVPRIMEQREVQSDTTSDDGGSFDDYEDAYDTFDKDPEIPYIKKKLDRKLKVCLYVGREGYTTEVRQYGHLSLNNVTVFSEMIQARMEKDKNERIRKTRERLNKVLLSDDYQFMKERNLL